MLIVESLLDGKRMPTYARDKIVALSEVSMFTTGDDVPLGTVLTAVGAKENLQPVSIDPKKADNDALRTWFDSVLPDWDRDRVYPSDIRKLIQWYNILVNAGITDFTIEEETTGEGTAPVETPKAEEKKPAAKKAQVKTQKSAATSAKTGVGARKG